MGENKNTLFLKDYRKPEFSIESVNLTFEIEDSHTTVTNVMKLYRNSDGGSDGDNSINDLTLNGSSYDLLLLELNGKALTPDKFMKSDTQLILQNVPDQFELKVVTRLFPDLNKSFEGLYRSGKTLVTQNEAQGFRKITYFLDRPDVMTVYRTTIIANAEKYPVLLSNGNLVEQKKLENGLHQAVWQDPFKKPCYLFAVVAGDLGVISDKFTTVSGKEVELNIYCDRGNEPRCYHAMDALKLSMKWDEEKYGREYDLDYYNIVAVDNFNAGAMENKGLNIFNSVYVLAKPETATDKDYQNIRAVIAHEYFHNWTGNRVTLRDWFQLSLKEGLTVFRDQDFSTDIESSAVKRIEDINLLRTRQFSEDSGPTAHPVRPQSAISVDNFFTVTIYEKGAEVIRMIKTLVGEDGFRKGMDLYFEKFDGMAVTTEDFVSSFEQANNIDLTQFKLWYDQAGTPSLKVSDRFFPEEKTYELVVEQSCAATPGQKNKRAFHLPLKMALLNEHGAEIPLINTSNDGASAKKEMVLHVKGTKQTFQFKEVDKKPIPSLLRGFSAPVNLTYEYSNKDLAFLMGHDADPFCRWEAGQKLVLKFLLNMIDAIKNNHPVQSSPLLIEAFGKIIEDQKIDPAFKALLLTLPDESYIAQFMTVIDVHAAHQAREKLLYDISSTHQAQLRKVYHEFNTKGSYSVHPQEIGKRSLKNATLSLLARSGEESDFNLIKQQFDTASNMTDEFAALDIIAKTKSPLRSEIIQKFFNKWQKESLVMNKWLRAVSSSPFEGTLAKVQSCMKESIFDIENPNKVYSLLMGFATVNPTQFHLPSGEAYRFIADQILHLDRVNPHVASYLAIAFNHWKKFDEPFRGLMKRELQRVFSQQDLSKKTYEIISKNLAE